jgi:hypothetical protein
MNKLATNLIITDTPLNRSIKTYVSNYPTYHLPNLSLIDIHFTFTHTADRLNSINSKSKHVKLTLKILSNTCTASSPFRGVKKGY